MIVREELDLDVLNLIVSVIRKEHHQEYNQCKWYDRCNCELQAIHAHRITSNLVCLLLGKESKNCDYENREKDESAEYQHGYMHRI